MMRFYERFCNCNSVKGHRSFTATSKDRECDYFEKINFLPKTM